MSKRKRIGLFIVFIFSIFSISLMTGCSKQAFSDTEIKNINDNMKSIIFVEGGPPGTIWNPMDSNATFTKISSWLKEARQYSGKIHENESEGSISYTGPSRVTIVSSGGHYISILPTFYYDTNGRVQYDPVDVLTIIKDSKTESYIQSKELYDFLKNNEWQSECTR